MNRRRPSGDQAALLSHLPHRPASVVPQRAAVARNLRGESRAKFCASLPRATPCQAGDTSLESPFLSLGWPLPPPIHTLVPQRRIALWMVPFVACLFASAATAMELPQQPPLAASNVGAASDAGAAGHVGAASEVAVAHEVSPAAAPQSEPELEPGALPVPEPGALLLVGTGLVGIALTIRRRRQRN